MKIKLFSFTVVFVLLLSGCANNLDTPELDKQKTVKAYFADGDTTKSTAVIDGNKASFMWASGDQISLVADGKNVIANNSLQEGASASSTDFTYNSEEFTFESGDIAIYPYNAAHTAETVELPSVYNLGNNTDNTNAIMYAEYDGNALSFKHLAGMLRFDIKNLPIETAKIVVTTDKGITGNFTIKESDGKKVIETVESKDGNNTVTINFTELTSKSDSKLFYIPLPVGTYQSIQVDIYDTDGCKTMASKVNVKNRDIVRAQMVRFGYTPEELPVKIGGRGYESLAVALEATKDKSNVDIELIGDVDLDISSSVITYGSSLPQIITIKGNGNTITFNHKNSDWNYIRLANDDSKWIIKNAELTNGGHNNGPQGRHNIRFYNEVELNQIVSDKAISLLNDAILENVTISDTHISNSEAYALWISAEGQTVTLKNCHFYPSENKTGDRAIKIADENIDVEQQKKVTLNISGCDFDSQKKAAVVVTSTAGADIVWGDGNNIEGVNMDKIHAVWVDEVRAQYYSDVNVTGCSKTLEGVSKEIESEKVSYTFNASAATEVKKYGLLAIMSDIELLDKDIAILNIPSGLCMEWETGAAIGSTPFLGENCNSNLTIKGEGTLKATGSGVGPIHIKNSNKKLSFEGITIIDESVSYAESAWEFTYLEIGSKGGDISFKDVTFGDEICASDGTFSFTGCSFESNESSRYAVWISAPYVTFKDCIVTGKRGFKAHEAYGSDIISLTIDACSFLNLEEKPGIAIGDVNESTSITISNCKFINCQPGDQSFYIYETDTPTTSFNFTSSNNITEVQ